MRFRDSVMTRVQWLLPQHALSWLVRRITHFRHPWLARALIRRFVRAYRVDLSQALETNVDAYPSFNAFFTRALGPAARPVDPRAEVIVSPVDGAVSAFGTAAAGLLLQAKGREYSVTALLGGGPALGREFESAHYATLYLSPRDYHRVHMPARGRLRTAWYVPGRLFSVNTTATRLIPGLFTRNERIVAVFDSEFGPLAVVLVGALFVGCMEVAWPATLPLRGGPIPFAAGLELARGAEVGRFNMGSTVIVLGANPRLHWRADLHAHAPVTQGAALGYVA